NGEPVLARVQLPVTVRDTLGIRAHGATGWSVQRCLARIAAEGRGVLVLLATQESAEEILDSVEIVRGKLLAPAPTAVGGHLAYLTIGVGSQILRELGVQQLRLMGAPIKYNAISGFELEVADYVSFE